MDATLYKADGTQQTVKPQNGTSWTLEELYALLGCDMVEILDSGKDGMVFIGDEEARCKDEYTINAQATALYRENFGITDPVAAHKAQVAEMEKIYGFVIDMVQMSDDEPYTLAGDMLYCPESMLK